MARSIEMVNIREILKYYETGINTGRAIGRILKIDKETVLKFIRIAEKQNIKHHKPEPNVDKIIEELKKNKLLPIKMLWEEYINEHPDGLGHSN